MVERRITQKRFKEPNDSDMFLDYVAMGRIDLVEDYLDQGGNPKVTNCKGETALHIATRHYHNNILALLLPYFSEDELAIKDMYGLPVHLTTIKYGNEEGINLIHKYYSQFKTKVRRNGRLKKQVRKKQTVAVPYTSPIMLENGDNFTNKNYQNIMKKDNFIVNTVPKSRKGPSKNFTKKMRHVFNNYLVVKPEVLKSEVLKPKIVKQKTKKQILNEINAYNSLSNLPEKLQYLPKGNYTKPVFEPIYNAKNTRLITYQEAQPVKRTQKKSQKDKQNILIKKEIPLANPVVGPSNLQNKLSENNILSMAKNLQEVIKENKKITKKKKKKSIKNFL